MLVLDGVFSENRAAGLCFHPAEPPTDEEIGRLLVTISKRILRHLRRKGLLDDQASVDPFSDEAPLLASCYAGSIGRRQTLGPQPGAPLSRIGQDPGAEWVETRGSLQAHVDGFNLHATLTIAAQHPEARLPLEKLVRYCARPSISNDRLTQLEDGRIAVELKTPWANGHASVRRFLPR